MYNKKIFHITLIVFFVTGLIFFGSTLLWAHGSGTTIVPESLSVKAGSELKVTVNGLVDTKSAKFKLTGISGKFDLGEFEITSDDFTQVLKIPADLPPGSYRLTVEGGKKKAKVVINVN